MDYDIKNRRRREAKERSAADFKQGKRNRRDLAWRGAFGTDPARIYNLCALGTSAPQRAVKAGKDEYDENSDYDR